MKDNKQNQKIIFVSRLDADCSLGAKMLCEIAPRIAKEIENVEIVIIGGGTEYEKIERKAHLVNSKVGRELIKMIGKALDPREYFTKGSLFVGVSRAALEAMSCGLPVLLLGNEGYLGLLDENTVSAAKKTNFTCRTREKSQYTDFFGKPSASKLPVWHKRSEPNKPMLSTVWESAHDVPIKAEITEKNSINTDTLHQKSLSGVLFDEILRYFSLSNEEKERLSTFSLKIIKDGYTAQQMARRTLTLYKEAVIKYQKNNQRKNMIFAPSITSRTSCSPKALPQHKKSKFKIALCGYYGYGNFGDEIILKVLNEQIKAQNPFADIRTVHLGHPRLLLRDLYQADLLVFGGGSLLQNITSDKSLLAYIAIILISSALCKRRIMLSNGFGPINERSIPKSDLMRLIAFAINTLDLISVRDKASQRELKALLPHRKIALIPDPALIEFVKINQELCYYTPSSPKINKKPMFFVLFPHSKALKSANITPQHLADSIDHLSRIYDVCLKIVVLNEKEDMDLASELKKRIKAVDISVPKTAKDAAREIIGAKFVISQRYHGSLLALCVGVPSLSVSQDKKIIALCQDFGLMAASDPRVLKNPDLLYSRVDEIIISPYKNGSKIDKNDTNFTKNNSKNTQNNEKIDLICEQKELALHSLEHIFKKYR